MSVPVGSSGFLGLFIGAPKLQKLHWIAVLIELRGWSKTAWSGPCEIGNKVSFVTLSPGNQIPVVSSFLTGFVCHPPPEHTNLSLEGIHAILGGYGG